MWEKVEKIKTLLNSNNIEEVATGNGWIEFRLEGGQVVTFEALRDWDDSAYMRITVTRCVEEQVKL